MPKRSKRLLYLETECSWFLLASALDFALTYVAIVLSRRGITRSVVIESNPLADWVLQRGGFFGLGVLKVVLALVVVGVVQIVARSRPSTARVLILAGTACVGAIVIYTVWLLKGSIR